MRTEFGFEIGDVEGDKVTLRYVGFGTGQERREPFIVQLANSNVTNQPMTVFYGRKDGETIIDRLGRDGDLFVLDPKGVVAGPDYYGFLGMKPGHNAEMTELGIPIPPGFTLPINVHSHYLQHGALPAGLDQKIDRQIRRLEEIVGKEFGNPSNPLLVAVRGAPLITMPGMMDTILDVGINDDIVEGLATQTGDQRFALDTYRRFIHMFADTLRWVPNDEFERALSSAKRIANVRNDSELNAAQMEAVKDAYLSLVMASGHVIPHPPREQLSLALRGVFMSAYLPQAMLYMKQNNLVERSGNTITIMPMVYGNMGANSGAGVLFTRNPNTGKNKPYGEYMVNAQGEDVVAGIRTPQSLDVLAASNPRAHQTLVNAGARLERYYGDMQEIEFTVQNGEPYVLQTRTEERSPQASLVIAMDIHREGIITEQGLVGRVFPSEIDALLHPMFDPSAEKNVLGSGIGASPGDVSGVVALSPSYATELATQGYNVILLRHHTSPEDVGGMEKSQGILTKIGGSTSHAAVVGRGMGKSVIVGYGENLVIYEGANPGDGYAIINGVRIKEGIDPISLSGATGEVIRGKVPTIDSIIARTAKGLAKKAIGLDQSEEDRADIRFAEEHKTKQLYANFKEYIEISKRNSGIGVRANAETPLDAAVARELGAEGIGLARTEHMFFQSDEKRDALRQYIFGDTDEVRKQGLAQMRQYHKQDFTGVFKAMDGLPVTVRLLDPPLGEFTFPDEQAIDGFVDRLLGSSSYDGHKAEVKKEILQRMESLKEVNPMMGKRGNRLNVTDPDLVVTDPDLVEAQVGGIMEAVYELKKQGYDPRVEIMIPLTNDDGEIQYTKEKVEKVIMQVKTRYDGIDVPYSVGTMVETPRAALVAGKLAKVSDFFSFGTNDLTQMTYAYSRDDTGKFLGHYVKRFYRGMDPFVTLDIEGVGQLVRMAAEAGRKAKPGLKLGICGEHGGDPNSIRFFHRVGLDYVSCSPYRVPVAIVAGTQATHNIQQTRR